MKFKAVTSPLQDRSLLITGGTGSFGRAFARHALDDGARRVAIYSRGESAQAAMRSALADDPRLRFFIGDVRDFDRLSDALQHVELVVHAAALKRIEVCEADPAEAVATNIRGTLNVARACIIEGVERAVFLSTDKAAGPNTLYGATKLCAERLWCGWNVYAAGTNTRLAATRYGNVLGSTGSVVPLWKQQHARGEPLTITDVRMTRFWMTMARAVDLVLTAFEEMRGGEVFVPTIGGAPIFDLARAIVEVDGVYAPGHVETGMRPGEKLHETLISEEEARHTRACGQHFVIEPEAPTWGRGGAWRGIPVPAGFAYRSDAPAHTLSVEDLRRMVA